MKLKSKSLSYLFLILFAGLFGWYFMANSKDFVFLKDIEPLYILVIGLGHLGTIYLNGILIKWLLVPFGKTISGYDSFYVSLISSIGNFFLPVGSGIAMRAVYLKQKVGLGYKKFMTTLYGSYVILFLCYGSAGLLSLLRIGSGNSGFVLYTLCAVFGLMVAVTSYLSILGTPRFILTLMSRFTPRVAGVVTDIFKGWNDIVSNRALVVKLFTVTFLWYIISLLINYASLMAIGASVGIWQLMLLSAMGSISLIINITPGSIGIREGLFIYASGLLSLTIPQVLAASLIERATKGVVLVVGWLFTLPDWKKNRPIR